MVSWPQIGALAAVGAVLLGIHTKLVIPSILREADADSKTIVEKGIYQHEKLPGHPGSLTKDEFNEFKSLIVHRLDTIETLIRKQK